MSYKNPTPIEWLEHISDGLEYRRLFGLEDQWSRLEAIYYNVHKSMMNDGPNIFLSQGDTMLSQITTPTPRIGIEATTPGSVKRAPILESLDNKLLVAMKVPRAVERASLHAYLFGRGIVKLGYDSEWGYDPGEDIGGSLQLGMTITQLNRRGTRRIEYDSTINPGMPWCRAVLPHDIILPWGVIEIEDTPWIAHRVVRHIEDLKADVKYQNTRDLVPSMSMRDFTETYRNTIKVSTKHGYSEPEWVEFYEIMDRRTGRIYAVAPDHKKFLRNDVNALLIDNVLPYAAVGFTPRVRSFWTTPDAFYLLHIQSELSDVAVQRTKQRRLSVIKLLYDEGVISEPELLKLTSPDVGAGVKINTGHDIDKAVKTFQIPPNLLLGQEEELLRANAREQMGFSRNQVGEFSVGRKTATEVGNVAQNSQLRQSRRGLQTRNLYVDIMRIANGIIFKHWNFPRYVEVLGKKKGQEWQQFRGSDLKGKYEYRVELTDASVEQSLKFEALQMYSLFSQDPSVDPAELIQWLTGQVNDPAFSRIFDAALRRQLQQVSQEGRSPSSNGRATAPQQVLQGGRF